MKTDSLSSAIILRRSLLLGAAGLCVPLPAEAAAIPVIDPTNLAQNVLQVARAIEQINNQIRQIEQQAQMLARSSLQLSPELTRSIERARAVLASAERVAFEAEQVGANLRELYPETYAEFDLEHVLQQSDQWMSESRSSLEVAMRAQAEAAQSASSAQDSISQALGASAGAEGQTSAAQAGNQLLGVAATQLAEIQTLLAAQGRALAIERMERLAREERASEIRRRAFPQTVRQTSPARSAF